MVGEIRGPLFIPEGPSDTAAILTLGFPAIGRPSCSGGVDLVCAFVRRRDIQDAVVVSDNDDAGRKGAKALARQLALVCKTVRVHAPDSDFKDVREWMTSVKSGMTRNEKAFVFEASLAAAEPVKLGYRASIFSPSA